MYDSAIIGTGPAGLSAALTLKARGKSFIWLGRQVLSEKARAAEKILNYPGLSMVSGREMEQAFLAQMKDLDISVTNKLVTSILPMGSYFQILADNEILEARTVILATGVTTAKPLPGEEEFLGRAVSYCATCDGFLYKGKTIAAICLSKALEEDVEYLTELAEKVYYFPGFKDPEITPETHKNVEFLPTMPKEIKGGFKADTLVFAPKKGSADSAAKTKMASSAADTDTAAAADTDTAAADTDTAAAADTDTAAAADTELKVDGIFILKEAISASLLLRGLETEGAHIVVDRACCTNIPGCFAAGDCTGRPYQYAKAVGEGNIAAHSVVEYLAKNPQ